MGLGYLLKTLLRNKGIKASQLADDLGLKRNTLYAVIQRDSNKMNMDELSKIAQYLGVSIDYFFSPTVTEVSTALSVDEQTLIRNYQSASNSGRNLILSMSELISHELPRHRNNEKPKPVPEPAGPNMSDEWVDGEFDDMNMDEAAITDIDHTSHYATESDNDNFDPA